MINIIALIISLSLIMYLAYKGYSTIITAPIIGLLTLLLTFGLNSHLMVNYTEIYMSGFAGFVKNYFPLFLTGAIFAKLMEKLITVNLLHHSLPISLEKIKQYLL